MVKWFKNPTAVVWVTAEAQVRFPAMHIGGVGGGGREGKKGSNVAMAVT